MTAVFAFCIGMRYNLSAISNWKCYLAAGGHRSGNDLFCSITVLSETRSFGQNQELKDLAFYRRSHKEEAAALMSLIHFEFQGNSLISGSASFSE